MELHQTVEQLGWEMVQALRTVRLTEQAAEALLVRLETLHMVLPQLRQAFQARQGE